MSEHVMEIDKSGEKITTLGNKVVLIRTSNKKY